MSEGGNTTSSFIAEAERIVLANVASEQFGVSELAEAMHMSRSNLLRKIKKDTELSASQFIRQVRLTKGMELLRQANHSVSEVSYQVGFSSVSYFIKCFREHYGYPPGEVGKQTESAPEAPKPKTLENDPATSQPINRRLWPAAGLILLAIALSIFYWTRPSSPVPLEKSIAVLPFLNESSDSANLYFVNGLMESTIGKLQKIEDLRVISRTSSEKYRNSGKGIPEIAEELHVSYLVEGSGQRVGDQVLLNIQLIEAASDRPIWTEQYSREIKDIFSLQNEVALQISQAIEAIVTPSELARIDQTPTDNLEAYDYFLQGLEPFYTQTTEGYRAAIPLFEQAVALDPEFALAYADIAISYYFLDLFQRDKQYTEEINRYSDQALLYDAQSDISLLSKAFYYLQVQDYRLALPHLEKALEYNPNSSAIVQMLSEYYAFRVPNTAKYLEYALRGTQLDVMGQDSIRQSYSYLHLSNALMQAGFIDEAALYVDKSLALFAYNPFAPQLKTFVAFAQDQNFDRTKRLLLAEWKKDTTRNDILKDIGTVFYTEAQYDSAYFYFKKLVDRRIEQNLTLFTEADAMMAFVFAKMGDIEGATALFDSFSAFCERDETIYQSVHLAVKHAYAQEQDKAMEQLRIFAGTGNFQYWMILLENDPIMAPLKTRPEFATVMQQIKDRFWQDHADLRQSLLQKGLL